MLRTRRSIPAALTATLLSVTAVAGCGASSHPRANPTTVAPTAVTTMTPTTTTSPAAATVPTLPASTTTGPTSTGPGGGAPGSPSTTAASGGQCLAATLSGSFTIILGSAGAGHVSARVVLTNTGTATCRTGGYVGMQLLGAGGTHLPTTVVRDAALAVTALTMTPGSSVSAVARFSPDIPGPADTQTGPCQPVAASTLVTPPNDTHQIVAHGPGSSVCESGTIDMQALQGGANAGG